MRDDPFFEGTPRKTLDMAGESFEFPILYYDFRMISSTFTAKTKKLKSLSPVSACERWKPRKRKPARKKMAILFICLSCPAMNRGQIYD